MERLLHALQDKFLQELRESKTLVAVFLVNGIRLQGQVEFFDNYIVAVKSTVTQLVYKHSDHRAYRRRSRAVQSRKAERAQAKRHCAHKAIQATGPKECAVRGHESNGRIRADRAK